MVKTNSARHVEIQGKVASRQRQYLIWKTKIWQMKLKWSLIMWESSLLMREEEKSELINEL